jgi:outer membrane protein assembly factor BamB
MTKEDRIVPNEMTSRTWGRWCLCAVAALALAACAAESDSASTTPLPTTAGTDVDETRAGTAVPTTSPSTAPASATAELCATGEFPSFGAFDLASGALQWSKCSPEETYRLVIGASDDVALVLESSDSGNGATVALDARDGTERWRLSSVFGLGVAPGPIDGQGIAVLETDLEGTPFVIGVDIATGVERWRIEPRESVIGHTDTMVVVAGALGSFSDAAAGPPSGLRGIDRATGEQRWASDIVLSDASGSGVARGAAALVGSTIAVPTGSTLTGVDITTGAVLWTAPQLDHPEAADGVIVGSEHSQLPTPDGTLRAVDPTTGDTLWSAAGRPSYGDLLAVGDGVVVVLGGLGAELVAYDLVSGNERWRVPRSSPGEPQFVSGSSLVVLWDGDLGVLSTADGSRTWGATQPLRSPLMSSVGSNGSTVFVAVNSLPFND